MKKINKVATGMLVMILSLALSVTAFASSGFNAGIGVTKGDGEITVDIEESTVLSNKKPTLSIRADDTFANAVVLFGNTAAKATYANGNVSFQVASGGTYYIVADPDLKESVAATCVESGKNVYTYNNAEYVETVAPTGIHIYNAKVSEQKAADATCTEAAAYYVQCDNCSDVSGEKTVSVGEANGHDFSDTSKTTCANCTQTNPNYVSPNKPAPVPKPDTPSVDNNVPVVDTTVTKNEDGSVTKTETLGNGAVVETTTLTDGTKVTTNVSAEGTVAIKAEIPAKVAQSGETVTLPVSGLSAAKDSESAAVITVTTNSTVDTQVEIPVEDVTAGTVVVVIDADGGETVLSETKLSENGVVADLPNGAAVKVVDNSKDFADISDNAWYKDAVDYVSARGIVNGMTEDSYVYDGIATRAQLWTILARMNGVDTGAGSGEWYETARQWAVENGVSDGSNPHAEITREQLVTMLWRYVGEPESDHDIAGFEDHQEISDWAYAAKQWANEGGVINGSGNELNPQGKTTRAQLAQFIMNFMENVK